MVSDSCGYFQVFESQDESKKQDGFFFKPHPYIISPSSKNEYKKGEVLEFSITIFGEYIRYMPYFIYSFELMGKLGFGEKRHKFQLREVKDFYSSQSVYQGEKLYSSNITEKSVQDYANFINKKNYHNHLMQFNLDFQTPARFVEDKKIVHELTPSILLDSIIRRYKIMHQFYGSFVESDLELGNLQLEQSKQQRYKSWKRYSNRQGKTLEQGGVTGSYSISLTEPKLALFLYCMEILHIGKSTTFGLGKVRLEGVGMEKIAVNGD
jgi:hypothetical protein